MTPHPCVLAAIVAALTRDVNPSAAHTSGADGRPMPPDTPRTTVPRGVDGDEQRPGFRTAGKSGGASGESGKLGPLLRGADPEMGAVDLNRFGCLGGATVANREIAMRTDKGAVALLMPATRGVGAVADCASGNDQVRHAPIQPQTLEFVNDKQSTGEGSRRTAPGHPSARPAATVEQPGIFRSDRPMPSQGAVRRAGGRRSERPGILSADRSSHRSEASPTSRGGVAAGVERFPIAIAPPAARNEVAR